jgi:hypothetical protein
MTGQELHAVFAEEINKNSREKCLEWEKASMDDKLLYNWVGERLKKKREFNLKTLNSMIDDIIDGIKRGFIGRS